jgi:hypothetical protein
MTDVPTALARSNCEREAIDMLMKVTDANTVMIFDPRGVVESANTPIAARPASLDGLRLAILDNSKWNANKILRTSTAALEKDVTFGKVNYYVKHSFSKDAAPELIAEIAANNDLVLTAIGDCGSCCSCCIRDAVALEKLGIPAAAIITTEFERETELTRAAIGMQGLIPVVIDHPVSSITQAEVESRAAQVALQAPKVWLAR